jgi:riboflavin kinase/FMN adenylyltransferase
MQHYWLLDDVNLENAWLTIGSFDGVHRGHQAIIQKLTAGAHKQSLPAVVLTFHPHPSEVLRNRQEPFYLTSPEERAVLLGELGVDVVITHPFNTQVANTSALDFITSLKRQLGLTHLCVGYDFALGHGREGNIDMLGELGQEFGYTLSIVQPVELDGEVVSSSQVRQALSQGDVERAQLLLGRPYQVGGQVVPGDGRGRTLGIPTANLDVWSGRLLPAVGVYACKAHVDGVAWAAVTNIGVRPTFEGQPDEPQIEAHLLQFNQDLYGQQVQLSFVSRLRDEKRFPNIQALITQINHDIQQAHEILVD